MENNSAGEKDKIRKERQKCVQNYVYTLTLGNSIDPKKSSKNHRNRKNNRFRKKIHLGPSNRS